MAQKMMRLQMKEGGHSVQMMAESSILIDDFLESSGLLPRDGSLRYALDSNDKVIKNCPLSETPELMYLGLPDRVLSVWIEKMVGGGVETKTILDNGDELFIPGLSANQHCHIFVSRDSKLKNGSKRMNGYRFRTDGTPYQDGDYLYVKIPNRGDSILVFDPKTGMESIEMTFKSNNTPINKIRGLWCVVKYHPGLGAKEWLMYCPEATFIPPGFKPTSEKKSTNNRSRKGLSIYHVKQNNSPWGEGIVKGRGKYCFAYIAGNFSSKKALGRRVRGIKDALGDKVHIVNSYRKEGKILRAGDTLHLRIPESENITSIFNPESGESDLNVRIHPPTGESLSSYSGRWVIAKVCKNQKIPDLIQVIVDPNLSILHQTRFKTG